MKTKWSKELCGTKPEKFQQLSEDTWIQRKNISEEPPREDGMGAAYGCESRIISADVYDAIMEERDSVTVETVKASQTATDEAIAAALLNQLDIMETQAEQDETMAEILLNQI